jgi:hypothetical protein
MKKLLVSSLALALLAGCSSSQPANETSQTAQPQKAAESQFITGREALQQIFPGARGWAGDAKPIRVESAAMKENKKDGKSSVWTVTFGSPSHRTMRSYTWSGSSAEGAPERGVTPGSEDSFSPNNSSTAPFDLAYWKADSPKAFEAAQDALKKHNKDVLKKAPDTPVKFTLFFIPASSKLVWRVTYGTSQNTAKENVLVNASSGDFDSIEK